MSIWSYFWPQILEESFSLFSGEIKVVEEFGKRRLEADGMTQSGGIVERIWRQGIEKISNFQFPISNCLILGLGGGTAARILESKVKSQKSKVKIVGVEIDPEIVRLGKKYFRLGEMENLEIITGDAIKYVNQQFNHLTIKPFDLVLVDIYQGQEVPQRCQTKKFLRNLKDLKSSGGLVVFNRLYSREKKQEADRFVKKCQSVFRQVETRKIVCNLMIYCR